MNSECDEEDGPIFHKLPDFISQTKINIQGNPSSPTRTKTYKDAFKEPQKCVEDTIKSVSMTEN